MPARPSDPSAEFELQLTRVFDAPRQLVFDAWTKPEHLRHWHGAPVGLTVTTDVYDFRPGGSFRICMRAVDGTEYWLQGVYREIVAPERIVFTHAWLDEDRKPRTETLVTIVFTALGERTEIRLHQAGFGSAGARDGHGEGWSSTFDRLAGYLYQRELRFATGQAPS